MGDCGTGILPVSVTTWRVVFLPFSLFPDSTLRLRGHCPSATLFQAAKLCDYTEICKFCQKLSQFVTKKAKLDLEDGSKEPKPSN